MKGDFLVRLTFYDNTQRLPVMLRVNSNTTANQLYSKITAEVDVKNKFQLFYKDDLEDDPVKQCDTPLSEIFKENEVDVYLVLTIDGGGGSCLVSSCAECPNDTGADFEGLCEESKYLTDDLIIDEIVDKREDAWSILARAFNISTDIQQKIEENSEDEGVRCIDVMHHIYHSNTKLTWNDVQTQVNNRDPHLAQVISECHSK